MFALVAKACSKPSFDSHTSFSPETTTLLDEYRDITLVDLPGELSPMRDIQYAIDLVSSS